MDFNKQELLFDVMLYWRNMALLALNVVPVSGTIQDISNF